MFDFLPVLNLDREYLSDADNPMLIELHLHRRSLFLHRIFLVYASFEIVLHQVHIPKGDRVNYWYALSNIDAQEMDD